MDEENVGEDSDIVVNSKVRKLKGKRAGRRFRAGPVSEESDGDVDAQGGYILLLPVVLCQAVLTATYSYSLNLRTGPARSINSFDCDNLGPSAHPLISPHS